MSYKVEDRQDATIITSYLSRATMEYALEFKDYVTKIIDGGKCKLIIDMSNTDFIDSTFIGVMVFALKKATAAGGFVRVVVSKDLPLGMLQQTRMDKVFKIYPDVDQAVFAE